MQPGARCSARCCVGTTSAPTNAAAMVAWRPRSDAGRDGGRGARHDAAKASSRRDGRQQVGCERGGAQRSRRTSAAGDRRLDLRSVHHGRSSLRPRPGWSLGRGDSVRAMGAGRVAEPPANARGATAQNGVPAPISAPVAIWGDGRCKKPLIYRDFWWSEWQDLNLRPPRPERGALPGCATLRKPRAYSGARGRCKFHGRAAPHLRRLSKRRTPYWVLPTLAANASSCLGIDRSHGGSISLAPRSRGASDRPGGEGCRSLVTGGEPVQIENRIPLPAGSQQHPGVLQHDRTRDNDRTRQCAASAHAFASGTHQFVGSPLSSVVSMNFITPWCVGCSSAVLPYRTHEAIARIVAG